LAGTALPILCAAFGLAGLAGVATLASAEPPRIGIASAVNPDTVGQPPNEPERTLLVGHDIIRNERITTKNAGQAQILFADQSSLTVAPNSELVIDEFIYDPKQHTGNMVANVTTGLLRYVGGKVSHEKDVTFNTPSAAITVRGGELIIDANKTGVTAAFVYGDQLCISTDGTHKSCTTSFNTCLKVINGQINAPADCPEGDLDKWLSTLQGSNL